MKQTLESHVFRVLMVALLAMAPMACLSISGTSTGGGGSSSCTASAPTSYETLANIILGKAADYPSANTIRSSGKTIYMGTLMNDYELGGASGNTFTDWVIWKSTDGGASWSMSDQFTYLADASTNLIDIAIAPNGDAYAVGFGCTDLACATNDGVIRKLPAGSSTWTTIKNLGTSNIPYDVKADSSGNIYVGGYSYSGSATSEIWKSTDEGGSWSTLASAELAGYVTYTIDYNSSVGLVASFGSFATVAQPGLLYLSADHGSTFSQIDTIASLAGNYIFNYVAFDPLGALWTYGGNYADSDSVNPFVRYSSSGAPSSFSDTAIPQINSASGYDNWALAGLRDSSGKAWAVSATAEDSTFPIDLGTSETDFYASASGDGQSWTKQFGIAGFTATWDTQDSSGALYVLGSHSPDGGTTVEAQVIKIPCP